MGKKMRQVVIALLGLLLATGVYASERATIAWQQINSGAVLIDVRTQREFAEQHLASAHNIEYQHIVFGVEQLAIDKTKPIVVYCRSGNRSGIAQQALQKLGYTVHNGGGLIELLQVKP